MTPTAPRPFLARIAVTVVAAACALGTSRTARPAPSADGWPQARRDAALSGHVPGPGLDRVRVRWTSHAGAPLSGEPIVSECRLVVTSEDGTISAFHPRTGDLLWSTPASWIVPPRGIPSALALDGDGVLHAGLPADRLVARARGIVRVVALAAASYAIDNNGYPPGTDLAAVLTPTYVASLPPNPVTGAAIAHSDVPSVGDYRYQLVAGPGSYGYHFGVWSDDGLIGMPACDGYGPLGLDPTWPVSALEGGTPTFLRADDGVVVGRETPAPASSTLTPTLLPAGSAWASDEDTGLLAWWGWPWWWDPNGDPPPDSRRGSVVLRDGARAVAASHAAFGGTRGGVARHAASGRLVVARAASRVSSLFMSQLRTIGTAIESYSIDNNAYPDSDADLEAVLMPTYVGCIGTNAYDDSPIEESTAPGDYEYERPTPETYRLTIRDDEGNAAWVFDTGSFVTWDSDRGPIVSAIEPDGTPAWRREVGLPSHDVTPVAIAGDLAVAGTTGGDAVGVSLADGSAVFTTPLGVTMTAAPVALPGGGGFVLAGNDGTVVALTSGGGERWRRWVGAPLVAAPSASDDLVYVPDVDGMLHALRVSDGSIAWSSYLGGPTRAGLTTTPIPYDGWIYVGRSDGSIVAAAPDPGRGRPSRPSSCRPPRGRP